MGEQRLKINGFPDLLHVLVHRVAVGAGIGEQVTVFVEQAVVHAPRVDAEAVQLADICLTERKQTELQLIVEIRKIPIEYAVHLNVVVLKPVQLAHCQLLAVKLAEYRSPVARAQVKGQ